MNLAQPILQEHTGAIYKAQGGESKISPLGIAAIEFPLIHTQESSQALALTAIYHHELVLPPTFTAFATGSTFK